MLPLISVITATKNRREMLSRALSSVAAQNMGEAVEIIVVDGVSTDGTVQWLAGKPEVRLLSEPDKNVYEAWNKGVRLARGRIICFLNSDDTLPAGALARVAEVFLSDPSAEMVSGAVEMLPLAGAVAPKRVIDAEPILALREQDIGPGVPITNGRFIARSLLDRVGPFDERWRLVSDRQWLLRAILAHAQNRPVRQLLYSYGLHAGSLTFSNGARRELAVESLLCAAAGLAEASSPRDRAAYARWHAWALAYRATMEIRHPAQAIRLVARGTRADPFWWARLPLSLWRHARERPLRLGRVQSA